MWTGEEIIGTIFLYQVIKILCLVYIDAVTSLHRYLLRGESNT